MAKGRCVNNTFKKQWGGGGALKCQGKANERKKGTQQPGESNTAVRRKGPQTVGPQWQGNLAK